MILNHSWIRHHHKEWKNFLQQFIFSLKHTDNIIVTKQTVYAGELRLHLKRTESLESCTNGTKWAKKRLFCLNYAGPPVLAFTLRYTKLRRTFNIHTGGKRKATICSYYTNWSSYPKTSGWYESIWSFSTIDSTARMLTAHFISFLASTSFVANLHL